MELVALGLLVFGVALAEPVSRLLARARWPGRDPVGALLLWQAIGLAGGLALLSAGVVYGLSPLGAPRPALESVLDELGAGRLPALDVTVVLHVHRQHLARHFRCHRHDECLHPGLRAVRGQTVGSKIPEQAA